MITDEQLPAVGSAPFFEAIVERSMDAIAIIDDDLVLKYVGGTVTRLLGWTPEEWVGRSIADLLDAESLEIAMTGMLEWNNQRHDPDHDEAPIRINIRSRSGESIPIDASICDTDRTGIEGYVVQLHPAAAARAMSDAVDTLLEGADPERVLWHFASLIEHSVTRTKVALGTEWDGTRFDSAVGDTRIIDLVNPDPESSDAIRFALRSGHPVTNVWEHLAGATKARATELGMQSCWCAPIIDANFTAALMIWHTDPGAPGIIYTSSVKRSVALTRLALQWTNQQHQLAWDVTHDQLTGLTNRAEFQNCLDESSGRRRAVLFCDLDDFKPVNERLGHRIGDQVLAAVAGRLDRICEPCVVARLGGDEFAILMNDVTDIDDAVEVANRVRDTLCRPIAVGRHQATVGVTIGIAFDQVGVAHSDLLLDEADRLLRMGKSKGKNQILSMIVAQ